MNPARQADSRHEAPTHTPFASPLSLLPSWAAGSYEYDDAGCGDVLRSEPRSLASSTRFDGDLFSQMDPEQSWMALALRVP